MIIKPLESVTPHLDVLEPMLTRTDVSTATKRQIEREIRNIQAGARGEREAAYELGFHYGATEQWAIIHDLKIECEGRVAQIDHLLINRFLDIWVLESKHFSEGLAINEHGECSAFFNGKPYGIASPFEQNQKHIAVLTDAFKTGLIKRPRRLGIPIQPTLYSLVLASKRARISRPKKKIEGIENILKNDQLKRHIDAAIEKSSGVMALAKLVSARTLQDFAQQLAALHTPISFDWHKRFGVEKSPAPKATEPPVSVVQPTNDQTAHSPMQQDDSPAVAPVIQTVPKSKSKVTGGSDSKLDSELSSDSGSKDGKKAVSHHTCSVCSVQVTHAEARYCWFNKTKFGGNVFCRACQKAA